MRVNRLDLLNTLKAVQPGLAKKEIVDQSNCFIFMDGKVMTYNEEIACTSDTELKIEGAVQAEPLLAILEKMQEDEVEIKQGEGELLYRGKKREGGIRMEEEAILPIDDVDMPKKWGRIDENFVDAVSMVGKCAGTDASHFNTTCVHIFPKWIEACDNSQVARFKLRTGISEPTLVRRSAIKHIQDLGFTEIGTTASWLHFRMKGDTETILSCRRYLRDEMDTAAMFDVGKLLEVEGTPITLPKGIVEAASKAQIFSQDNSDDTMITIQIKSGKMRITGRGVSGWYRETKAAKYEGPPLSFRIDPRLLEEITNQSEHCEITEDRLKIESSKFTYVTCLEPEKKD